MVIRALKKEDIQKAMERFMESKDAPENGIELNGLWVFPQYRGRGVSLKLILYIIEYFIPLGVSRMEVYNPHFAPSNMYYKKLGGKVINQEYQMDGKLLVDIFSFNTASLREKLLEKIEVGFPMEYELKGITLRTATQDDVNEVARMYNFGKGEISLEDAKKAINRMNENHKRNYLHKIFHIQFAIFENKANRIIGWCGLDGRNSDNDNLIHIFYMIDKDYRRQGYATECAKKLLEYGFKEMEIHAIHGGCSKDNIGSKKVS